MPTQIEYGKSFEYAVLVSFQQNIKIQTNILNDENFLFAKHCYYQLDVDKQKEMLSVANKASQHIILLEPKLINPETKEDIVTLQIQPMAANMAGDVRDILTMKLKQGWEIGICAKRHTAVKHSRLSETIDFGKKWINSPCSIEYFENIKPIFLKLKILQNKKYKWTQLENKENDVYVPLLNAFQQELKSLTSTYGSARKLIHYLIGDNDFYKIIQGKDINEIQGFNLHGTLNTYKLIKPSILVPRLKLPTKIASMFLAQNNKLIVNFDEGWCVSFRIHNANSLIEPSLKFDINLATYPHTLYSYKF